MEKVLFPGSVLTTINHNTYEYYICPSTSKHGCIYFGKGLKSYLIKIKQEYCNINDYDEYVINCNGRETKPEILKSFLKNRDECKIFNFCKLDHNIIPHLDIMKFAAKYSCKFINTKFSFRQRGHYCFEIVIKSYLAAIKKTNASVYRFNMIDIYGFKFYNSRSISNYVNFYLVYKRYKTKEKIYLHSNCIFNISIKSNKI
jgi:hypothetical protein